MRSILAAYGSRPPLTFADPVGDGRTRRLGLGVVVGFRPASARATVLRRPDPGASRTGQTGWRVAATSRAAARGGAPRPAVTMHWARSARRRADRRAGAAPASWPG